MRLRFKMTVIQFKATKNRLKAKKLKFVPSRGFLFVDIYSKKNLDKIDMQLKAI